MYKNRKIMTGRFIEECRNHLLQMNGYDFDFATQTTSKTRSTKMDNKLKSKPIFQRTIRQVKNTTSELRCLHECFSSEIEVHTNRDKRRMLSDLKELLICSWNTFL